MAVVRAVHKSSTCTALAAHTPYSLEPPWATSVVLGRNAKRSDRLNVSPERKTSEHAEGNDLLDCLGEKEIVRVSYSRFGVSSFTPKCETCRHRGTYYKHH